MAKKRVYADTSVVGGNFDREFEKFTVPFWDAVCDGKIIAVLSDVLADELKLSPKQVREFYESLPLQQIERVALSEEAKNLADKYIAERVVGQTSLVDCRHIAIATINQADFLVSWNFKHIVNVHRIRGYNAINMLMGYPVIDIRTPAEVIDYEQ